MITIEKLTEKAISLLKNLIETQSFSSEEEQTAALIEAWFIEFKIPFQRTKNNVWATNKYFDDSKGAKNTISVFTATTRDEPVIDGKEIIEARFIALDQLPDKVSAASRRRIAEATGRAEIQAHW